MGIKKAKKWAYGSILIIVYLGFFVWQESLNLGVLPLVAVTSAWAWLFYKATGIDFNFFPGDK
jgi:hypothetical protein